METCKLCNGKGSVDDIYICHKCDGEGKTDWVTNAMHKNPPVPRTSIHLVNIRQVLRNTEKIVMESIIKGKFKDAVPKITGYLEIVERHNIIHDWMVQCNEANFYNIDVYIKPTRTVEMVRQTLKDLS